MGNDSLRPALEHYRQKRSELLGQLKTLEAMIRQLESDLGESSSVADDTVILTDLDTPTNAVLGRSVWGLTGNPPVRPDEFFGMTQSDAAKTYLRKVGGAVPFEQLVTALQSGGAKLGGADPAKTLYVSLARNPRKEFVWPGKDHISLAEFYNSKKASGT